jgi:outer membrane usher protein
MKLTCFSGVIKFFIFSRLFWVSHVIATQYDFDAAMLNGKVDLDIPLLSRVSMLPGRYYVDVYLNGSYAESADIDFFVNSVSGSDDLSPCLSIDKLEHYGIKIGDYPRLMGSASGGREPRENNSTCAQISAIPEAKVEFDVNQQVLKIKVPQAAIEKILKNNIDPALWSDGISAFLMNYRAVVSRYNGPSYRNDSYYLNLYPGFNVGPWRVRNALNATRKDDRDAKWTYINTYAERGLNDINSRLWLGESYSRSSVFDSVPIMGAVLSTDVDMLPYHLREKTPVIRGLALVDSTIEIRQGGYLIHTEVVPSGPYQISDVPAGYSGGELQVTVLGGDGSREVFSVPYSRPAIVLPEKSFMYSAAGGVYRSSNEKVEKTPFGELTLAYGTSWDVTLLAGAQYADKYQAFSMGVGVGLGFFGDISIDSVAARAQRWDESLILSQKNRVRYNKFFDKTGSGLSVDSALYSNREFLSMSDVMETYRNENDVYGMGHEIKNKLSFAKRSSTRASLSQSLNKHGNINLSAVHDEYYGGKEDDNRFNLSYSNGFGFANISLSYDRSKVYYEKAKGQWNNTFGVSFSIPIDFFNMDRSYLAYRYQHQDGRASIQDVSLRSTTLDKQLSFGVRLQNSSDSLRCEECLGSVDATWYGKYAELGGGYSHSENYESMNASLAGGMLLHQGGMTFGQSMNKTVGLVVADGADDVSILNSPGVRTDGEGHALVGYLMAYRVNEVALDPKSVPEYAFLNITNKNVIPTAGAIVPIEFPVTVGGSALITLKNVDATSPPFGAIVTSQDKVTGLVDEMGRIFVFGLDEAGMMQVSWSEGRQCSFTYDLINAKKNKAGIYEFDATCI